MDSVQPPEPNPPAEQIGRNQWDAAVEIVRLLGKGAPYIIILAACAFGIYKYVELSEQIVAGERKARDEANATFQNQISEANKRLIETYNAVGGINAAQLNNIKQALEVHSSATERLRQVQDRLQEVQKNEDELKRQLKQQEDELARKTQVLAAVEANRLSALATLGALGTLVDEAPELLRAVATTDAVQIVLQKSDQLLGNQKDDFEVQQNRIQILLAFADLQGFVGAAASEEKLARGALTLAEQLRASERPFKGLEGAEAAAHASLGAALALQEQWDESIEETNKAIRQFDLALLSAPGDARLLKRKAVELENLGSTIYRSKSNRDLALSYIRSAVTIWSQLLQKEPDNLTYKQSLAWAHYSIAEIEVDQQNLENAGAAYDTARQLINEIGDRIYRSNEWLDRKAEIYISWALCVGQRVRFWVREREIKEGVAEREDENRDLLNQALAEAGDALVIAENLARDKKSWGWQATHGSALHALGELKLLRWVAFGAPEDLDQSIAELTHSYDIRKQINIAQPTQSDWMMYSRWTRVNLNEALARRAERNGNYKEMRKLYAENVDIIEEALKHDLYADDWHYQLLVNKLALVRASMLLRLAANPKADFREIKDRALIRMAKASQDGAIQRWRQLIALIDRHLAKVDMGR